MATSPQVKRAERKRTAVAWVLRGACLFVSGCLVSLMTAAFGPMISSLVDARPRVHGILGVGEWGDKYAVHWELVVYEVNSGAAPPPVTAAREASLLASRDWPSHVNFGAQAFAPPPPPGPVSSRTTTMIYSGWPVHCLHGRSSVTHADMTKRAAAQQELDGLIPVHGDFAREAFIPTRPLFVELLVDSALWGAALYGIFRLVKSLPRIVGVRPAGECRECGYSLTGLAKGAACPECGKRGQGTTV